MIARWVRRHPAAANQIMTLGLLVALLAVVVAATAVNHYTALVIAP